MFTRCPKCKTVHPLTAASLSRSTGLVKCGRCDRIFNALSFLSDDWHASQPVKPPELAEGELPVLGGQSRRHKPRNITAKPDATASTASGAGANEAATDTRTNTGSTGESGEQNPAGISGDKDNTTGGHSPRGWLWGGLAVILLLITVGNMAWTFRDSWIEKPAVQQWLQEKGWVEKKQAQPRGIHKEPAKIQLVSRDMHTHPTRTGILVLSVTFVNLAERSQAFPILRITLLDGGNQPIAQRRFQPQDYLRDGANIDAGLAPDVFLPVLLELTDPGEQAVGFEIEFL
jgi:predicted Zn finger-like uncharacterized protein